MWVLVHMQSTHYSLEQWRLAKTKTAEKNVKQIWHYNTQVKVDYLKNYWFNEIKVNFFESVKLKVNYLRPLSFIQIK